MDPGVGLSGLQNQAPSRGTSTFAAPRSSFSVSQGNHIPQTGPNLTQAHATRNSTNPLQCTAPESTRHNNHQIFPPPLSDEPRPPTTPLLQENLPVNDIAHHRGELPNMFNHSEERDPVLSELRRINHQLSCLQLHVKTNEGSLLLQSRDISEIHQVVHHIKESLDKTADTPDHTPPSDEGITQNIHDIEGETKPKERSVRVMAAKRMECSDCINTTGDGSSSCQVSSAWSFALKNRPPGTALKTGSILGAIISQNFRRTDRQSFFPFFPKTNQIYSTIFVPSMRWVSQNARFSDRQQLFSEAHLKKFFSQNDDIISSQIRGNLNSVRATRKQDTVTTFKKNTEESSAEFFMTADAINRGDFRRTDTSPVDNGVFLKAVREAFRIGEKSRTVTLSQLGFACYSMFREYVMTEVNPRLFQIVPGAGGSRLSLEQKTEINALLCASLAAQLESEGTVRDYGWETTKLDVINDFAASPNLLQSYMEKLGTSFV